jgi:hypothetical protein
MHILEISYTLMCLSGHRRNVEQNALDLMALINSISCIIINRAITQMESHMN